MWIDENPMVEDSVNNQVINMASHSGVATDPDDIIINKTELGNVSCETPSQVKSEKKDNHQYDNPSQVKSDRKEKQACWCGMRFMYILLPVVIILGLSIAMGYLIWQNNKLGTENNNLRRTVMQLSATCRDHTPTIPDMTLASLSSTPTAHHSQNSTVISRTSQGHSSASTTTVSTSLASSPPLHTSITIGQLENVSTTTIAAYDPYDNVPYLILSDGLDGPRGVAVHPKSGEVFVASTANNKLCRFHGDTGNLSSCEGAFNTSDGGDIVELNSPHSVTVGADGRLVITDAHRVIVIENNLVVNMWGSETAQNITLDQFNYPRRTAVDGKGDIYVADSVNQMVKVINPYANNIHLLGQDVISMYTRDIAINPINGDVMVLTSDRYVFVFNKEGQYQRNRTLEYSAHNLSVDNQGYIVITEGNLNSIHVYDPMWHLLQTLGSSGDCAGCFYTPYDVDINEENNNMIVVDIGNNRVQMFMKH